MTTRSRAFTFTINNWTRKDMENMYSIPARYLLFAFEVAPSTKTEHIQGYIYFENARTLPSVIKAFKKKAHIEIAKGNLEQNQKYISKSSESFEFGDPPHQGLLASDKLDNVMSNPRENFHLYNQYQKCYKNLILSERSSRECERKLHILTSVINKVDIAKTHLKKGRKVLLTHSTDDFKLYNGHDVVIMDILPYSHILLDKIDQWINGIPPSYNHGYEIREFDPDILYLNPTDDKEYDRIYKILSKHIQKCPIIENLMDVTDLDADTMVEEP